LPGRDVALPDHDAAYWAAVTKGMDFFVEDRVDGAKFNRASVRILIFDGGYRVT
jgi:hypothetical protein